jgi:hypothetical protein
MKMPSKGSGVYVEGYGRMTFAGASNLDEQGQVHLKHHTTEGDVFVSLSKDEFDELRVYPEQVPPGEPIVESRKKLKKAIDEAF